MPFQVITVLQDIFGNYSFYRMVQIINVLQDFTAILAYLDPMEPTTKLTTRLDLKRTKLNRTLGKE